MTTALEPGGLVAKAVASRRTSKAPAWEGGRLETTPLFPKKKVVRHGRKSLTPEGVSYRTKDGARLHVGGYRDKVTRYHCYMAHPAETRGFRVFPNGK